MGTPHNLILLMQTKDPITTASSHERAAILYVMKNDSTGESSLAML